MQLILGLLLFTFLGLKKRSQTKSTNLHQKTREISFISVNFLPRTAMLKIDKKVAIMHTLVI